MRVFIIFTVLLFGLVLSVVYYYPDLEKDPSIHTVETHLISEPFMSGEPPSKPVALAELPKEVSAAGSGEFEVNDNENVDSMTGNQSHELLGLENQGANLRDSISRQKAVQLKNVEVLSGDAGVVTTAMENTKGKIAVIVHQSNVQNLSHQDLKEIYLHNTTRWSNGAEIILYNLPLGDEWRDQFSRRVMKMSALDLYQQQKNKPISSHSTAAGKVKSKNLVVSYVERDPKAIAYVPLDMLRPNSGVRVIMTLAE